MSGFKLMAEKVKTVLISCGSFNPITNEHLRMFELARDYLCREANHTVIAGIISPTNDKYETTKPLAAATHRCAMAELALRPLSTEERHWVKVDHWESTEPEWHRTLDVLDYHYKRLNEPSISLKLLCGADLFHTFNTPDLWRDEDIRRICGDFGLVVITREGSDPWHTLEASPKATVLKEYKNNIIIVKENILNTISSTAIRGAVKRGDSIRYLVPDPVVEYIKLHRLYH